MDRDRDAEFPRVASVTLDSVHPGTSAQFSRCWPPEWNIAAIKAPDLWNLGITGAGIVFANMDTGVDGNHPDLQSKWRGGLNSWYDPYRATATPYDLAGAVDRPWHRHHGRDGRGDAGGNNDRSLPRGGQWMLRRSLMTRGSSTATNIHLAFQWLLDPDGILEQMMHPMSSMLHGAIETAQGHVITDFQADIQN